MVKTLKRDYKFWVVLLAVAAFAVFVWPTPFEYRTVSGTTVHIWSPNEHWTSVQKFNRFTGERVQR